MKHMKTWMAKGSNTRAHEHELPHDEREREMNDTEIEHEEVMKHMKTRWQKATSKY